MLQRVAVGRWSLDAYRGVVPEAILEELREQCTRSARRAHPARQRDRLRRRRLGAAALLRCRCCATSGSTVDWKVIGGSQDFFRATKALHNGAAGRAERR